MTIPTQTLQAIADKTGVSRMSVSRALRNQSGVSPKLRDKICRTAQELGYRPNPLITTLMTSLRNKIRNPAETGFVLAFVAQADVLEEARFEHFAGAERAADQLGYKLEKFIVGKAGYSCSRLNDILLARNIYGVILGAMPEAQGSFKLNWEMFSTVRIEYTFSSPVFDCVVHDHYNSFHLILNNCRERGFKRVGLLYLQNHRGRTLGLYEAAYWKEIHTVGDFSNIPPLCLEAWNEIQFLSWYKRYKPQVILSSGTTITPLEMLFQKIKVKVPETCSLINLNEMSHRFAGIDQNNPIIGATAAQMLIDKVQRNVRGIPQYPSVVLIPGTWVDNVSLRKANPS